MSKELRAFANSEAQRLGLDPGVVDRLIQAESSWNPNAIGPVLPKRTERAIGLTQLLPSTARDLGVNPYDAKQNITGGLTYLKQNLDRYGGDYAKALASHNWGPNRVAKYGMDKAPSDVHDYVSKIMGTKGSALDDAEQEFIASALGKNKKQPQSADTNSPYAAAEREFLDSIKPPADDVLRIEVAGVGSEQEEPQPSALKRIGNAFVDIASAPTRAVYGGLKAAINSPPERPGAFMRGAQGLAQGIADPINALGQMFTQAGAAVGLPGAERKAAEFGKYVSQQDADYKRNVRGGQDDFDVGRMAGNVIGTAPVAMALPVSGSLTGAAAIGAGSGAITGALQPVTASGNFGQQKLDQLKAGALSGAIAGPVGNMLGRAISPNVSPQVALLRSEGVTPTPGQILGGGWQRAEEKLTSVPLLGQAIAGGQRRANEQFNQAAINRALNPIGQSLPKGMSGREAIDFMQSSVSNAYDDALNSVGPIAVDRKLLSTMNQIKSTSGLKPDVANELEGLIQANVFDRAKNGYLTPEDLKGAVSELGRKARGYISDPAFDNRELGQALQKAHDALRDTVSRQAPKGAAQALKSADTAYANLLRVQRAASSLGAEEGTFTAAQLQNAVKSLDPTKSRFARGDALMQDLSEAGKTVLQNKTPDSGTAGRLMAAGFAGGAAGGAAMLNPWLLAGAAPALAYTPLGQRAIASLLTSRQGAGYGLLSDAARRAALPAGVALTPALQGLLNQ